MGMIENIPPLNLTVRSNSCANKNLRELKRRDRKNIPEGSHLARIEPKFSIASPFLTIPFISLINEEKKHIPFHREQASV